MDRWTRILIGCILLGVIVSSMFFTDKNQLQANVTQFIQWVHSLGYIAPLVLLVVHSLAITVCFPITILFEWGAGFLFGIAGGSLLVFIAKGLGASICFILGRTLLRDFVSEKIKKSKSQRIRNLFENVGRDNNSWTFALLLRLSPLPSWVNNYGLSLTSISYGAFIAATVGNIPMIVQNAYIGSLFQYASSISISEGLQQQNATWRAVSFVLGLAASILTTRMILNYANNSFDAKMASSVQVDHSKFKRHQ